MIRISVTNWMSLTLVAFLMACNGLDKLPSADNNNLENSATYRETTDNRTCVGNPIGNPPTIYSTWKRSFQGDKDNLELTYQIDQRGFTHISKKCIFPDGANVTTELDVPSSITLNRYAINQKANHTTTQTSNGAVHHCSLDIAPINVPYVLHGNCMGFVADAHVVYFVH